MARRPRTPVDGHLTEHSTGIEHIAELIRHTVPPLHPAGTPFIAGSLGVAAVGYRRSWIRVPALLTAAACAGFFRHPARVVPTTEGAAVAPADGEVTLVDEHVPPRELGLGDQPLPRVSIFLSVFDAHVQRAPLAGVVDSVVHTDGKFLPADLPDASDRNERTSVRLATEHGPVGVVQIAGLVARRIRTDCAPGDSLELGETYGIIRFGSRVDTYFPAGTELTVYSGQRAVAAETVIARLP
ncbi:MULTISPECIES: phosphatidylserine decarboxylase [Tsukamurella]|uniref:Phosphatidylserine decarboxylase proenzyme n=2 Tax=Tsukamurella TaxID=2060 RepID=A0A5C5S7N5_9ACTN|nr:MULTISPECIES: phosphatidylserine decarboxylase [Tsukamurella]NMD55481.1 phosphatidylserine decarboxylase [Tsukamurella columbiensis]TWS30573.1 phosphatidylserine decarboxylase [Tsukamurella conjunctivitidis]